jgi:predicted NACHT family NTPase
MAKRSLQASASGARLAKQKFNLKGWTQEYLACKIGLKTRQPIWRFFASRPIERFIFFEICTALDLDWREVAVDAPAEYVDRTVDPDPTINSTELEPTALKLDNLVQIVRSQRKDKVNHQCGILKLLDISRPVDLDNIYIDINVIEQIPSQQGGEISDFDSIAPEDISRFDLDNIAARQILGTQAVEKYGNLRVLGKTGSGKSIFLKRLAMQCNAGKFAANQAPVFMALRDFAESCRYNQQVNLLEFIQQEFLESGISQPETLNKLLQEGRILFLIDGLDEICQDEEHKTLNEVRRFCERFHKNTFVTTCRTASQKLALKGFTDVQITPLNEVQITAGTRKWFEEFSKADSPDGLKIASQFVQELKSPENWQFRPLMATPLFLHLACSIFHRQKRLPIKAKFYKQCMDLLVWKWDEARGMDRNQSYPGFALPQKLQLWSEIALSTFEKGQYFFDQRVIEDHIASAVKNLTDTNSEEVSQAIEAVLCMVKSQDHGLLTERARGIFSFSYSAMQQYCIARKIFVSQYLQPLGQSLQELVTHLTDRRWHKIFLLTASMLHSSDDLLQLMKQKIDYLVAEEPYLQDFLFWTYQKNKNNLEASPDLGLQKVLHACEQLSGKNHTEPNLESWRNDNCMTRLSQFKQAIVNRQNTDISKQQVLQSFYDANQLLIDCLNSSCEVTSSVREEIEASLLCYSYCYSSYSKLSSTLLPMEV